MNHTPQPPKTQVPQEYLVTATPSLAYRYFGTCEHAQTLLAYSVTLQTEVLFVLPCGTWSCRFCAQNKIKQIAAKVQLACPNRLMTLTVDPSLHLSPKDAWQNTRKQVPVLIRRLRKKFGEVEYLRVTEVTKRGWPHYHLLIRSGYLPHAVVKAYWQEQTGARIVDLRQVTKTFSAYTYLVKYLSKLHDLEWTERHVSMSRGFTPKSKYQHPNDLQTAEPDFHRQHPAQVILEYCQGCKLKRLSNNAHAILHPDTDYQSAENSSAEPVDPFLDS